MNHYTQLLLFIKELAETHPLVNTVTHGNVDNLDLDKSNIFPLVHISISDAQFSNGQTLTFPITIECLSERDFNKEIITNKFWGQDNEVDNHNETLAILNFMWTSIYRDWNDNNLTTSENATAEKIEFAKGNILDGWSLSFDVEVPNTELCLDLITTLTYNLTLSSGANGTATSSVGAEGVIVVNSGTNVAAYAIANTNYQFSRWTVNTVPVTTNPYPFIMNRDIDLVAEFISIGVLLQQFFIGVGDIVGNELIDHSGNFNATIHGKGYDGRDDTLSNSMQTPIQIDLSVDGLKYEFHTSLNVGDTVSGLTNDLGNSIYGIIIQTTGTILYAKRSVSPFFSTLNFNTITWDADNSIHRLRIRVSGNNVICEKTIYTDDDYSEAISQSIDITTLPDVVPLNNVISFGGARAIARLNGIVLYANIGGQEFNFEDGELSDYVYNSDCTNRILLNTDNSKLGFYTSLKCINKSGYTRIYYKPTGYDYNIFNLPYLAGVSQISTFIANYSSLIDFSNIAYEEFPNGDFGRGWGFSLDSSIEPYDFGNTYFDISSNPNIITLKEQPTILDNRIYYDRVNNNNILIYDVEKIIYASKNFVGKKCLIYGDSTASAVWSTFMADLFGMDITIKAYGGQTIANMLIALKADEVGEPTLISDKDLIIMCGAFNDYAQDRTIAQLTSDLTETTDYLISINPLSDKILCGLYNFGSNPIPSSDTQNAGGMSFNDIRTIFSDNAVLNNLEYCSWQDANITVDDLDSPGYVHTYRATGGLKLANKVTECINNIIE